MKPISLLAVILAVGLSCAAGDADAARRIGGGKSVGMQKQVTPDRSPAATPAPAPAAAGAGSPAQAAKPASAAPSRSWLGPVAGLAAGLGLAALASHFGFGEELASVMMMAMLAFAVLAVVGFIMRRKSGNGPALAAAGGPVIDRAEASSLMQRQASTVEPLATTPTAGRGGGSLPAATLPADFDAAGFERSAKVNYIRLQAANDAGNLDDIRQFTTPEMFGELSLAITERGAANQRTDVLNIEAKVIDLAEEENRYVASVRFTGLIRENADANPDSVDEVWHLVKARTGTSGWLLAGIQQLS